MMVWDGACEFCEYWVRYWQNLVGEQIEFRPYQEVAKVFPDINPREFLIASHFIDLEGNIYSGARGAYRSLFAVGKLRLLDKLYLRQNWFRSLSDKLYYVISHNRARAFKVTKFLFGSDPLSLKPFWAIYLFVVFYLISRIF